MRSLFALSLALLVACACSGAPNDGGGAGSPSLTGGAGGGGRSGAASAGTGGGGAGAGGLGGAVAAAGKAGNPVTSGGTSGGPVGGGAGAGKGGADAAGAGGTLSAGGAGGATAGAGAGGIAGGGSSGGRSGGGAGGMAGVAGSAGDDRCNVAVYDASKPPTVLSLTGNLGAHDPALIEADGTYYLYATGNGVGAKTSKDLKAWSGAPAVFGSNPAWIDDQVPGATNLWAPDIAFFGGQYHLYYAASTFGSNKSCIGHATRDALGTGSFTDHGSVLCSNASGSSDNYNAIDPNVVLDQDGTPWMTFGSFWSGIKLVKLKTDGTRDGTELTALADRPKNGGALEGPYIVRRCGYYYLFVSWGACCDTPWDYNMRVGRSTSLAGPYTDKAGTAMLQGGGTLLVAGDSTWTAPGHNAVIFTATGAYNVYHALNASHANATLRVAEIAWDDQGWPVSAGP